MTTDRRIEYTALSALQVASRNPKLHADSEIQASVGRFGYVEPIILDERTGRIVAGHGRREALINLQASGAPPPEGIQVVNGEWCAPVLRGWASKNDLEAEAYLIASNKLVEIGGWDEKELAAMLTGLADASEGFSGVGFSSEEFDELLLATEERQAKTNPDDIPAVAAESYVKPGDLWILGKHRILCGDSTVEADVARLMDGEAAGLMNTDPPYGTNYAHEQRPLERPTRLREKRHEAIANDELTGENLQAFLEDTFRAASERALYASAAWYIWHADMVGSKPVMGALETSGVSLHRRIIWVKPVHLLGRGMYHWKHESCFMGWVKPNTPPDYGRGNGERDQFSVWNVDHVTMKERQEFNHATPKPVELFEIPIIKHLRLGEICYEPFSGSGPQIIAAEKTGRRCFAMELEPRFVQCAIERWQSYTGGEARLVNP